MEVIRESPILRARDVKKSSVKTRQGFTMCKTTGAAAQPPADNFLLIQSVWFKVQGESIERLNS